MKANIKELLVDLQPDPNVDPALAAANAVELQNADITPYEGNTVVKNVDNSYLGNKPSFNVAPNGVITFDVDFAQASALGVAPPFGKLLRAAGMAEVIDTGVDVRYTPVSENFESIFARFIQSNEYEHDLNACKTNFSIAMAAESRPLFSFTVRGGFRDVVAETASIVPDLSAWQNAVPVTKSNTPTMELDGYQGCVGEFTYDHGNDLQYYTEPGCEGTALTDRSPSGTFTVAAPPVGTKDLFALAMSHEGLVTVPIQIVHGTADLPQLITINLPRVQLSNPRYVDRRGDLYIQFDYIALPTAAGNDEIELIF